MKGRPTVSGGPQWGTAPQRVLREGSGSGCHLMALEGHSGALYPLIGERRHDVNATGLAWTYRPTPPLPQRPCLPTLVLTSQPHINERVINQHQFVEVELVGEPLPLGLVQNAFVVIIAVGIETPSGGQSQRTPVWTPIP